MDQDGKKLRAKAIYRKGLLSFIDLKPTYRPSYLLKISLVRGKLCPVLPENVKKNAKTAFVPVWPRTSH